MCRRMRGVSSSFMLVLKYCKFLDVVECQADDC